MSQESKQLTKTLLEKLSLKPAKSPSSTPKGKANAKLPPLDSPGSIQSAVLLTKKRAINPILGQHVPGSPRTDVSPLKGGRGRTQGPALRGKAVKGYDDESPTRGADNVKSSKSLEAKSAPEIPAAKSELPYVKLIETLREYPTTEDFVYLKRMDQNPSVYDPYALDVVPFSSVNQQDFYTMSTRGVTHYVDGMSADFATLDQWERELKLFSALGQLRVFKLYKLWRSFRMWKKAVNQAKFANAKSNLEKNLFLLSPVFQKPICHFHNLCHELSTMRLHAVEEGKTYTLAQFVDQHEARRQLCESKLQGFHDQAFEAVMGACNSDLEELERRLEEFNLKKDDGETLQGSRSQDAMASSMHKLELARQREQGIADFAYTVAAARRSEQRRILSFVRMGDYMICDTLKTILLESVRDLLSAAQVGPSLTIRTSRGAWGESLNGDEEDDEDARSAAKPKRPVIHTGPLFDIELLLGISSEAKLVYEPDPTRFQDRVADILSNFVASLCSLTRLYGDSTLMNAVLGDKAEEVEPGTEIQELVANDDYDELVSSVEQALEEAFEDASRHKDVYDDQKQMVALDFNLDIPRLQEAFKIRSEEEGKAAPAVPQEGAEPTPVDQADSEAQEEEEEEEKEEPVTLATFRSLLDMLAQQQKSIESLPAHADVSSLRVNLGKLKEAMLPSPTTCLAALNKLLPNLAAELFSSFMGEVENALTKLKAPVSAVEEYVDKIEFLAKVRASEKNLDRRCNEIQDLYALIAEYSIPVPAEDRAGFGSLDNTYSGLKTVMEEVEGAREESVSKYSSSLEVGIESINKEVKEVIEQARHEMVLSEESELETVVQHLTGLKEQSEALVLEAARINKYQTLFKLHESKCEELDEACDEVNMKLALWQGHVEFNALTTAWAATPFESLSLQQMEETVQRFHKSVFKMERGLPANKLVPKFRRDVDEYRDLLPVVVSLHNRALKDRHWHKVFDAIGTQLVRDGAFTLQVLLDAKVQEFKDSIVQISTEATQELALEELLAKVSSKWVDIDFAILPYKEVKDCYILGGIEDVQVALEDSMVTMSTILASRFVAGIRAEVEKVEKNLRLFSDTLDEWIGVQKAWMYLEPIFSSQDIQKQLPVEAKAFVQADKQIKEIMRKTKERPNALLAGIVPGLLETFQRINETLEGIQKNLEDYLETKRIGFPRFYFLSNDELLEILAQTKNVQAVQPHMGKCFDGIRRLDFGDSPTSTDIYAMISGEGEKVSLGKNPLKARGNVEVWLSEVEKEMIKSLKRLTKQGFVTYLEEPRVEWVLKQPAQLVIAVSQVYWCAAVEACLKGEDPAGSLTKFLESSKSNLADLTKLVRGELSGLARRILAALITIDVHARDIVNDLRERGTRDVNEFEWQMQLRYYMENGNEDLVVRQVNAKFAYAYEYLGAQGRLVVTAMTDRCYLTLTGALHLKLGGAPAGPAGTGKTETTKDLGKALGVNCVVFNCGDNLDYKFMGKFFSGLAQCGAWACFDEFNRIDIEVLSVVAQQLLTIQNALKAGVDKFNFEGRMIKLLSTCGVFITMNPGYAGRTELPDNLKALFRPMAMMIPDYALVAEVMLFSEGFEDSKTLSRKMVKLYKLASEQLSQQDHYDFGMRAVKSVLVMAGSLKRANPDLNEDVVLIRAMRDSNLPKFLVDDVELFQNIISDLFPGVDVPDQDHGDLEKNIKQVLDQRGLQKPDTFVTKIIQLYDTMNVRFGVMIVGPTGGGKSECYRTLQGACTRLRTQLAHRDQSFQVTHTYTFNPKCIKMGELYGEYSALTNEWTDGLGSTLIRNAVADTTPDKKWVVFDGPVDAIWIENMNTVLDDNCTLCLPNGERIKLNPTTMRMLFEVQDLSVASPATVSRCGMVYIALEELGWKPYIKTWTNVGLKEAIPESSPELRAHILSLFESHVDVGLAWLAANGKQHIPSVENNLTTSLSWYIQSLMHPSRGFKYGSGVRLEDQITAVGKIFAFAYTWALGGNLIASSKELFDTFAREQLQSICSFPGNGLVFDYMIDSSKAHLELRPWGEIVPAFSYNKELPYFSMLVPTVDTVRYSHLLEVCLDVQRPVLFSGVTGVGKSVIAVAALEGLREQKGIIPFTINFSAQTSAIDTQLLIESKLEKKRKTRYGAPVNKKIVFLIDDVNMPAKETYGAQPPIELLRQFQDQKGFYDRKKLFWKDIEDTTLVAACAPPGGGRQEMTPRFVRHFTMLCVPPPSEAATKSILFSIFNGFLLDFPPDFRSTCQPIVNASVEAYTRISEELLPTPAKNHYTFNLRDLSKVFQGSLMILPSSCPTKEVLTKLWLHESLRVFHDRLINDEDKVYFKRMMADLMKKHGLGAGSYEDVFPAGQSVMFGDYLKMGLEREERRYELVTDYTKLLSLLNDYLEEYNLVNTNPLSLVFFSDAVDHISRISRILRQPRGNAMLVGVGGSGKASLTRFATFMGGFKIFSIELTRGYGSTEFREDLKKLYNTAGIDGQPVVFLFSDTQIVNESFLEDVNNMLNSGEVPGMFAQDDKDRIATDIREWVIKQGGSPTKEACYSAFINRVRDNLHIVLTMSPVGDAFRARCRQFPSLINCCTIDWFSQWPDDALLSVSRKFLAGTDLGGDEISEQVANMCVRIHMSVSEASDKFYAELRRKYYTTPKSYLDLINLYLQLLKAKREEYLVARDRLLNGLFKLNETNSLVDGMKGELAELAPILEAKGKATADLLVKVAGDQKAAEEVKRNVEAEEKDVKTMQEEIQVVADDAKADLEEAMPALNAAIDSLKALNKNDIVEIKSFAKPPALVQMTMEAVCILKGEKADWDTAKRLLGESNFMSSLQEFDKDNIPEAVIKKLKKYVEDPIYTPEAVAKQSRAAMSLCMWTRAMDVYYRVAKVVGPKRQKLREAEMQLADANRKLAEKQQILKETNDRVDGLKRQLATAQEEQKSLNDQAELTRKRLTMAGKLTSALADEGVRWQQTADTIQIQTDLLVGDVFLSSACIAYYGAFTGSYRQVLVQSWIVACKSRNIPVSSDCSLRGTLASPVEVREWNIWGLPTDDVSIDNGILVTRGKRWPLMIDPQGQANTWVKNMESRNGLRVIKLTDSTFLRTLENSIRIGNPVLIEDVGESLDPALEPVLSKAIFKQGGRTLIRLGDSDVDYDPNFKFYLTTKLSNPHYLPEVCIKVTIINFTVTTKGLEDQLLGKVVSKERPDLEDARDRLVVSISNDKKQLKDLEDKILKLLKESQGNILDDEALVNTLNHSKLTSSVIANRVQEAEVTERSINEAREHYRPAATRGSILYFVIADLSLINPMYQFSLVYFSKMFSYCIDRSEKADDVPTRLGLLSDFVTRFIFNNVSRGLFEEHKSLYSFLLCASILRHPSSGDISSPEWDFLVRGPVGLAPSASPASANAEKPAWVGDVVWKTLLFADGAVALLAGLALSVSTCPEWEAWASSSEPHTSPLPDGWEDRLQGTFSRLCVVRVFREEKLIFACSQYVGLKLGTEFTEPAPWTLDDVFPDTTCRTPVIFILSTGADPTAMLQRFGEKKNMILGDQLHLISLGQGQGPIAEMLIGQAAKAGHWVCLQNCHLASSWMLRMEEKVEELSRESNSSVHPDFRLWLTSMPSSVFPVLVLQNGIKLTNEPPKGVKANVNRTYNDMSAQHLDSCKAKPAVWRKLLFSLSFFHAVMQERRKFGPLGWNIRYEFNNSDLECSMMTMRMFLDEQDQIPWPALEYVIGQINYGGRVTDDLDRRCLMSILRQYITPKVLDPAYQLTPSGIYYVPKEGDLEHYRDYVKSLPATEEPEVFGMHPNANISFQLQETRRLMEAILSIQPRVTAVDGGKTPDEIVAELAASLLAALPSDLGRGEAIEGLFDRTETGQLNSLSVVLGQEMDRFNRLSGAMRSSLVDLQKAIKGLMVMSSELESMYNSFLNNQVPILWSKYAYPSLKPLASWIDDYHKRIGFMRSWLVNGPPKCFWLPGFFFPQGFMTGVLQMHARKHTIAIDTLSFGFKVTSYESAEEVPEAPEDGIFIDGLNIDGARWDREAGCLEDSLPGVMFSPLPIVHFFPAANYEPPEGEYQCPLYKTSVRAGVLSTTGQSTNYVLNVSLPISKGKSEDYYVLQAVALLCMLND